MLKTPKPSALALFLARPWCGQVRPGRVLNFVIMSAAALTMVNCSFTDNQLNNPPGEIQIRLPWSQPDGTIRLENIKFTGLSSLAKMTGIYAQIYVHPTDRGSDIEGRDPALSFVKMQGGYYLPKNTFSLELASVYAHLERLGRIDASLVADSGLSLFELNSWPRKVGVRTLFANTTDENPAFYNSTFDAMFFQSYSRSEMPLQVNGGVIAHEHFHSLFQRVVLDPLITKKGTISPKALGLPLDKFTGFLFETALFSSFSARNVVAQPATNEAIDPEIVQPFLERGFNEGLADVWGWIYTQDVDFVGRTFAKFAGVRSLDLKRAALFSMNDFSRRVVELLKVSKTAPFELSYQLGSQSAGFVRAFLMAGLMTPEALPQVEGEGATTLSLVDFKLNAPKAKSLRESIVKSLLILRDRYLANGKSADTTSLIRVFVHTTEKMNLLQCLVARDFLREAVLSSSVTCAKNGATDSYTIEEQLIEGDNSDIAGEAENAGEET